MPAIRLHDVSKSFKGRPALVRLSLDVSEGDIFGLLGPNGSGKTTTMRLLLGLEHVDAGTVEVLDVPGGASHDHARHRINALPESHGVYDWMRGHEYLGFFAGLYGVELARSEIQNRLQQVGLERDDRRQIRSYSRGMKQRLGLARALVNDPDLLLLDEPTTGLDPRGRRSIHDLLLETNRERGTTIVLSTHILDDVERLCTRIAILDKGRLRFAGTPTNAGGDTVRFRFRFAAPPKTIPDVRGLTVLGTERDWVSCRIDGRHPSQVLEDLVRAGGQVAEAHQESGGLEELYLAHTSEAPQ
jgi:ABC-2 type transport system ATP-binding protein